MANTARWRWLAMAAGLGVGGAGCSGGVNLEDPPAVQRKVELVSFAGPNACTDLEQYIEDTAVNQMRTQLEAARDEVPSWGWWGGWGGFRGGVEGDLAAQTAGAPSAAGNSSPPPSNYTTTNNQVQGVDEADFVKNDGTRIFALSGDKLYATRSWPASAMALQGKLQIQGWPRQMFLQGTDKAVVFSSVWEPLPMAAQLNCRGSYCGYYYANTTKMTVVDVSDLTNLKVTHEYFLPGSYNNARMVGSSIRMVMSDGFNYPPNMKWYPDYTPGLWEDKAALKKAYNDLIATNETEIRKQSLKDWLPDGRLTMNGVTNPLEQDCSSFRKVNAPVRLGTVTVATLNLDSPERIDRTTIMGESGEIFASQQNLYVANRHWWWWPQPGQTDTTYLHKFDISDPNRAVYVASGTAEGHIVDQFSMDEDKQGYFRIATTIATREPDPENPGNWWGRLVTTNRLSVLNENSGSLEVIGKSEDVAKGERITSSRLIGDTGYVVTFRQVDPLFVFDLSDPTNPHQVGELKVPGFSSYIHPLDDNHLLTIGTYMPEPDANGNTAWDERAVQLAIFDVTDRANPKQTFMQKVGTSYSYSEAQTDHKAFNYFPAKKLLAIPFSTWGWGNSAGDYWSYFISDLRVFSIDALTGITPKGSVSLWDMYKAQNYYSWSYYWTPQVRRSVMADDFVYAISDAGIRVANIANLSAPIATVNFDRYVEQY